MSETDRIQRLEALLQVDKRIADLESGRPRPTPIWKNAGLVAAYGAVLALVPALITGVAGWVEKERQIGIAAEEHQHQRTLAYLGLAIDPESTEAGRQQVLRFLASLGEGDPIGEWALAELTRVQQKLGELEAEKDRVAADLLAADAKAQAAEIEAASLLAQADAAPKADPIVAKQAAAKKAEADHLKAEVERKRDEVDALSTRIGDTPLRILQMRAQPKPVESRGLLSAGKQE